MQALYWNETIAHIRAGPVQPPREVAIFEARVRFDQAWQNLLMALDSYTLMVIADGTSADECYADIERIYANRLLVAAGLVEWKATKLAALENR